jgi:predicted nuclease of restriction endonuclease-like (RecB) superfamily
MNSNELTLYRDLLGDIKTRVRAAQHRAALSANSEMIRLYWDIGRLIAARQEKEGWGAGVIPRLALGLKNELPEEKGFSERNIKRMLRFYKEYAELPQNMPQAAALLETSELPDSANVPQPVAQITPLFLRPIIQRSVAQLPWGHNILLFEKIKHLPTRLWYAEQALEQGWSRNTLVSQIKQKAHQLPRCRNHELRIHPIRASRRTRARSAQRSLPFRLPHTGRTVPRT